MALIMAVTNPVNQSIYIRFLYLSLLFIVAQDIYSGFRYAIQGEIKKHKVKMVHAYVWSTFGSGAIRFTSWILWCLAKFFS